jgi:hypothetical protein
VTLRRVGRSEPVEVVAPDELARRKEEAEWEHYRRSHGLDQWEEHARLALKRGETITVPDYTGELWWFVRDVNGVDRTVTAATVIFEQPRERTFPFDLVEPLVLSDLGDENEAARVFAALDNRLRPTRRRRATRAA